MEGVEAFDVEEGKRLVLAIEEDASVDVLHRCDAYAKFTTCRVEYVEGEPERTMQAEREILQTKNLVARSNSPAKYEKPA